MCLRKDVDVRTCVYFSSPFDIVSVLLPFISLFFCFLGRRCGYGEGLIFVSSGFFFAFWFGLNIVDTKSFCFLFPLVFCC